MKRAAHDYVLTVKRYDPDPSGSWYLRSIGRYATLDLAIEAGTSCPQQGVEFAVLKVHHKLKHFRCVSEFSSLGVTRPTFDLLGFVPSGSINPMLN